MGSGYFQETPLNLETLNKTFQPMASQIHAAPAREAPILASPRRPNNYRAAKAPTARHSIAMGVAERDPWIASSLARRVRGAAACLRLRPHHSRPPQPASRQHPRELRTSGQANQTAQPARSRRFRHSISPAINHIQFRAVCFTPTHRYPRTR